jgi:hypothetical protein
VREHLQLASLDYQRHLARFVENHDERRALEAFGPERSQAVATLALTLPGLRLVHEGQLEGRRLKLPVQLGRRPVEPPEPGIEPFYRRLLAALSHPVFRQGQWQFLPTYAVWSGNDSYVNIVAHGWVLGGEQRLVVVNLSSSQSQCFVPLDWPNLAGRTWRLMDLLSGVEYDRDGSDLLACGLYLDMPGYGHHLFQFHPQEE